MAGSKNTKIPPGSPRFPVPFSPFYRLYFDAFQQQLEVRPRQLQLVIFGGGQLESSPLQDLVPDHKSVAIPDQYLDPVAALVEKKESLAAQQFVVDVLAHQATQAVEALAHVGRRAIQKVPLVGVKTQHGDGPF